METHAHHLHQVSGHGWKHYMYEFLMLFLAVFCGFLAENQREHLIERKREKQFIISLLSDLREDTLNFKGALERQTRSGRMIDELITLLKSPDRNKWTGRIYFLAREIPRIPGGYYTTDNTYEQMRSSGNLRLLRNADLLDSLGNYYSTFQRNDRTGPPQMQFEVRHDLFIYYDKLFDAAVFQQMTQSPDPMTILRSNPALLTNDPFVINEVCMRFHNMYFTGTNVTYWINKTTAAANRMIKKIEEEYNLK